MKKIFNQENYFLLLIFLLPTYLLRFSFFGLSTNLWEILAVLAIILAIVKIKKENNFKFTRYEKKIIILFLIIIIGLVLGMIKSGNYRVGLGIIKSWFLIPFKFTFLASRVIEDKKRAYISLLLSTLTVAIIAIGYKIFGIVTFDSRLQAFFNSPNYLAMFLAPGIIIGSFIGEFKKLKLLKFLTIAMIGLAVFFTYSYAAWISILISITIIFLLNRKISKRYLSILILIFFVLIFILKDTTKFNDLITLDSRSSFASRTMIWTSANKILWDNYVLGIGPGNFEAKYLEYQKYFPPYLEWAVPHPHNLYLTFWLYGGLIGLLSFLAILYLFFKNVETSNLGVSTEVKCIALGIVIYFLIHGLVDTTIFKNDLAVIFWLSILI